MAKTRTEAQKNRRRERDRERRDELAGDRPEPPATKPPIPALKVQRMGKLFRIAYTATRNLAKFNSGDPVDGGGFDNEIDAQIGLSKILGEHGPQADAEAEGVG